MTGMHWGFIPLRGDEEMLVADLRGDASILEDQRALQHLRDVTRGGHLVIG